MSKQRSLQKDILKKNVWHPLLDEIDDGDTDDTVKTRLGDFAAPESEEEEKRRRDSDCNVHRL